MVSTLVIGIVIGIAFVGIMFLLLPVFRFIIGFFLASFMLGPVMLVLYPSLLLNIILIGYIIVR